MERSADGGVDNDQTQQRRGLLDLWPWESRRAPAVCYSAWLGVER